MRELFKSILRFSWATLLWIVRQGPGSLGSAQHLAPPAQPPSGSGIASPGSANAAGNVSHSRLDTSTFVVLGEGLAAGMGDFSLYDETQRYSFPAQMAQQMGASFDQPLIQPPGIGDAIGFAPWSAIVPSPLQSTVFNQIPPAPMSNLSVPTFTVSDAVRLRPRQPLIDRASGKQTAANLILGLHGIAYGSRTLPTQLESAVTRRPTLALIELGYSEALEAAVGGKQEHLPRPESFREDYSTIVRELRSTGAEVIALSIPDPTDTAHFATLPVAASIVKLDLPLMIELWNLPADSLITANGLSEIAAQLYAASVAPADNSIRPLRPGSVLPAEAAGHIQSGLHELNHVISEIAVAEGAVFYDLHSFIEQIRNTGATVAGRTLTGDYLGGFYSLNGYYPGATGQALIANEILGLLNRKFGASFPLVNVATVLAADPVAAYKKAQGPNWSRADLTSPQPLPSPPAASPGSTPGSAQGPPQPPPGSGQVIDTTTHALQLPPGLEQVLPLNPELSYFGDAISAQNCRTPQTIQWGSGGELYFRGLAMMDSHLAGNIRIKFTPPVDDWTSFQVSFEQGLVGTDSLLAAPAFFEMAGKQQRVGDVPGKISGGRLNLSTGQVDPSNGALNIYVAFFNSALFALLRVNPDFPTAPLSFPGPYGSATVKFEQRADGMLDFTFFGSTFVPLGDHTSFPLNFSGPSRQFASIPANGSVLHPHMSLTTKATQLAKSKSDPPEIPFNSVQEFTLFTPISSFGDAFTLQAPQVGGPALGRSRLLGRVQIQFGPKTENLVSIAVSTTTAGGLLTPLDATPIAQLFPGRLTPGPEGFYENLRFPLRTYSLNDLSVLDDPFDISVGALDIRTGESLQPLLHRGFINQDLIFALLRVEPRTPKDSFFFRGFATLQNGQRGGQLFRCYGSVHIPYPPGFLFPDPNLATGFSVVGGGALDPYLWIYGMRHNGSPHVIKTGRADHATSSRGDVYSYNFAVSGDPHESSEFVYKNHTQQGEFRMHSLTWVDFGTSTTDEGACDVVTFSCFGVWRKAGVELVVQAAAQFTISSGISYVGIQIGAGGEISNVNTLTPSTAYPLPSE